MFQSYNHVRENKVKNVLRRRETFRLPTKVIHFHLRPLGAREEVFPEIHKHFL